MWFKYRDIDFEYNEKYITEKEITDFFDTVIDLSLDIVKIFEISIEDKPIDGFEEIYPIFTLKNKKQTQIHGMLEQWILLRIYQ